MGQRKHLRTRCTYLNTVSSNAEKGIALNPLRDTCHRLTVLRLLLSVLLYSETVLGVWSYWCQFYYGIVLLYECHYSINALPVPYEYHSSACPPYKSRSHIISFRFPALRFRLASLILWLLWLSPRKDSDFQLQQTNITAMDDQIVPSSLVPSQRYNHTRSSETVASPVSERS